MILLLRLWWEFFKTGLFAVGGGLATLPFLYEMSARTGWFTTSDISDMIAVSESTPGPMGVNMATFVGFRTMGIPGGIVATLGLITPPIIVILIVSRILAKFRDSAAVNRIFYGLRPASTGLIAAAGLGVARVALLHADTFAAGDPVLSLFNFPVIVMAVLLFFALRKWKKHPILYIAAAAVIGIVLKL